MIRLPLALAVVCLMCATCAGQQQMQPLVVAQFPTCLPVHVVAPSLPSSWKIVPAVSPPSWFVPTGQDFRGWLAPGEYAIFGLDANGRAMFGEFLAVSGTPGPGPGPNPPVPPVPPQPQPIVTQGLHILILEESGNRASLSVEQLCVLLGRAPGTVRAYAGSKCAKLADGSPAFAMIDKDLTPRGNDPFFAAAAARPHATLPWWVCASESGFLEGPVPADNATAVASLAVKFGPAPQAAMIAQLQAPRPLPRLAADAELVVPAGKGTGYRPRKMRAGASGLKLFADVIPVIPRGDWPARIATMNKYQAQPSAFCDFGGSTDGKCRDQQQTSYCWINAGCHSLDLVRRIQGLPVPKLSNGLWNETSAASCGGPITGYRNEGGFGLDGVQYLSSTGGVGTDKWPNVAISSSYYNSTLADRPLRKAYEWIELESNNTDQLGTAMLLGYPTALGLDWWGHEILCCELVQVSANAYGWMIRNSWGDWGTANTYGMSGFQVLSESKSSGDAVLLRAVTDSPIASASTTATPPPASARPAVQPYCPTGTCPLRPTSMVPKSEFQQNRDAMNAAVSLHAAL